MNAILTPSQFASTPVYDLLTAAAAGHIGVDQRLLRAIVDRGEAAVADLVRFGLEEHPEARIDLDEDLLAIIQYLGSPAALPFLIDYLRREPTDPSEDLVHAFQRIGEPAVEPLLNLYRELGPEEGSDVAFVLAAFRLRDPRILELLVHRIKDDPADAAFLMGVHGDPAARPVLENMKAQAAADSEFAKRLGNEADEALQLLEQTIDEETPEPVSLWDLYPEHIEPVFDVLSIDERIAFLRAPTAELRADAAGSFVDREVPAAAAEILTDLAANDPNVGVRAAACTALGSLADDDAVYGLLLSKLQNPSCPPPERCGALIGLAPRIRNNDELKRFVDEFYANQGTAARAVEAMWRSLDPSYAEVFKRHLYDADIDLRRQAIKGVGFAQLSSEAPRLIELFDNEEFRLDALFSFSLCVPMKTLARGEMPAILRKIEDLAGGLSDAEGEVVETALDTRLILNGMEPVFLNYRDIDDSED